jgi:hypothetical protein
MNTKRTICAALLAAAVVPAMALTPGTTTFEHGKEGWQGPQGSGGVSFITRRNGDPTPAYRTRFEDFGITFANSTNADFVGDYTALPALEISLDVFTKSIRLTGQQVTRELVVELRDYDDPQGGYPYTSVWAVLGTLDASAGGWQHLSVTIADTHAAALPTGWGGYGAEDPVTFEPTLPPGRSFASVLAGVDEIASTTLVPGWFFAAAKFDVMVDNLSVGALPVPEPASMWLFAAGLAGIGWRRRARS